MIVEDDKHVALVLEARLQSFGHEVCTIARTGPMAVRSALQYRPDLILMDILLEGDMNGVEAAERIQSQLDVPIVFITCLSDQGIMDRAIKTNVYGYVLKPYDNAELRYTIEIALLKHKSAIERKQLIRKLENALADVKQLSGLLPICSACKKIRNGEGRWQEIEEYIQSHSGADFSHGICPECSKKLYPELFKNK